MTLLKGIATKPFSASVVRLADSRDTSGVVTRRLVGAGDIEIGEAIEFIGGKFTATQLLDRPFEPALKLYASRFSDGSWPVLYSSMAVQTATAEVRHNYKKFWGSTTVHLSLLRCDYSGPTKDLRPKQKLKGWAKLTDQDTNNKFCKKIGSEASKSGVAALLAPSVRDAGGTNVVVFSKNNLSNPAIGGQVRVNLV